MQLKTGDFKCPHCINGVRFNGEEYEPCEHCDVDIIDNVVDLDIQQYQEEEEYTSNKPIKKVKTNSKS